MVAFELHVGCEQFQYSMYTISAACKWLFGCASTKAAGQFICSAVKESELALLCLLEPSYTLGLAPSHRELQPPAEPLSSVNCYQSSLMRALLGETNCPGQHIAEHVKMFMPLLPIFTLRLLLQPGGV